MTVEIMPYVSTHASDCLRIFLSNCGPYFTIEEEADFQGFLAICEGKIPYFVATIDNRVVACGGYTIGKDAIELCWGMVDRAAHGERVGTALLTYRLKQIDDLCSNLPVKLETSQLTQRFYEKFGFVVTKVVADGFEKGLDQVFMKRGRDGNNSATES